MTPVSLTVLDYVLLAFSCFFVILGLFRGASGMFSLVAASVISFATAVFSWSFVCLLDVPSWAHFVIALVIGLAVFGLVRVLVKRIVFKLLAQPADSIFGFCLGIVISLLLIYIASNVQLAVDHSVIAREAGALVKAGLNVR